MPAAHSVQERYAPQSICFGCGPANPEGLRIRSFDAPDGDGLVAEWHPEPRYAAFPGVLNGGICGALLDCHANWTASMHFMRSRGQDQAPPTVTAGMEIRFVRPTPVDRPLTLRARVVEAAGDRATCEGELAADGRVCATIRATFVAVGPGHPAYHRWE
jgi:acyl-coenzyme A thioesterase PaaI-like protein